MTGRSLARVLVSLAALAGAVLAASCGGSTQQAQTTTAARTQTTAPGRARLFLPRASTSFAAYANVPLVAADAPAYAGPATPHSLDGVRIVPEVRKALRQPGISEALTRNGFVVVPASLRLFQYAYEGDVYTGWPVFVTTDVAYHEWHQIFDKVLRSLEQQVLLPKLEQLVAGSLDAAHTQAVELAGTPLADPASRLEQLFQLADAELGQDVPLGPLARREKTLVDAHDASAVSPLIGMSLDYSVFTPRGHYTRDAALGRYFTAMSVLGQLPFCLPGTSGCPDGGPARMGILAARILASDADLAGLWRVIYEPTAFLVGLSDDYTPSELSTAAAKADRDWPRGVDGFASDATLTAALRALEAARPVRIDPEKAAVRFMGARFVLDSYLLDQLVYPNVGSPGKARLTPSGLDLAAAFGSQFAYETMAASGATAYEHYGDQLDAVRRLIATRPAADWGSTVYDAWLHALAPMFSPHEDAFPDFMRTRLWSAKDTQSALGSWTELRHDTVLYSKQFAAEGGGDPIPPRRNWVEPDPAVYGRLAAVAELMRQGLLDRDLLTRQQSLLLRDGGKLFRFLQRIAEDELAGRPIAKADNDRLTWFGGELEALWWRTADSAPGNQGAVMPDQEDAVVADIGSSRKGVFTLATGRIDRLYVLVPDDSGSFQVAVGGVYSYYEFTNPPGQRLDDASWRSLLDAGKQPGRPAWESAFMVGKRDTLPEIHGL